MTDAGWAEKKVRKEWDTYSGDLEDFATSLLKAAHTRSVRIVKAARKGVPSEPCEAWKDGYMTACDDILTALQKGRT